MKRQPKFALKIARRLQTALQFSTQLIDDLPFQDSAGKARLELDLNSERRSLGRLEGNAVVGIRLRTIFSSVLHWHPLAVLFAQKLP